MESLLEHCEKDFRAPFYFSERCIPFPGTVKWILSDQWGFCLFHSISLRPDKTGGFTLASDWPESCFSKQHCRGCSDLTFNELDIYTFHTDKSVPVHMEGPTDIGCAQYEHCRVKLNWTLWLQRNRLFILMHNGEMALIIVGLRICFTKKINRKVLPKVYMLLWFAESEECLFCFCTESLKILGNTL